MLRIGAPGSISIYEKKTNMSNKEDREQKSDINSCFAVESPQPTPLQCTVDRSNARARQAVARLTPFFCKFTLHKNHFQLSSHQLKLNWFMFILHHMSSPCQNELVHLNFSPFFVTSVNSPSMELECYEV